MDNIFSIEDLMKEYPFTVKNGKIDYELLVNQLASEILDLKDRLEEKDYQILSITKRLDALES